MNRRYKATITKRNTLFFLVFFDMQLKLGFSVEKKMLYMQCINISVPISLSTYIQWRVIKGAGGVRCGGCGKMLHPVPLFRTVSYLCKNIFEKIFQLLFFRPIKIRLTSSCHFFLSDLSILWQCKGILSSKRNHKFKHIKAASTKPLGRVKFIFSNPPPLFCYRHTTAYICIYKITQVKYL